MKEARTPLQAYKAIIDQLVDETRKLGSADHVAKSGIFSNAPDHRRFNAFISTLTPAQRESLAQMLQAERDSAIHDVLAVFTWWIDCKNLGFTFRGKSMPVQLSGMGLNGDYLGRLDKWEWPDEEA